MAGKIKRYLLAAFTAFWLLLPLSALAESYVQGFGYDGSLRVGEVVSLADKTGTKVKAAPAINSGLIYGVVVDPNAAALTLNRSGQQVFVATSGNFPVFVSNEHGDIGVGDYLSLSATDGIAAKATPDQPVIIGRAAETFSRGTLIAHASDKTIRYLKVNVEVVRNPNFKNSIAIPAPLRKVGNAIAGQEVSPFKIYSALVVFLAAVSVATVLIMVGVRSGLTAIGRNPLSRQSVLSGLFQVVGAAIAVFIVGLFAVYLLLRL